MADGTIMAEAPPPSQPGVGGSVSPAESGVMAVSRAAAPGPDAATARGFLQRLETALQGLVTLRVVTLVGDVSIAGDASSPVVSVKDTPAPQAASTEIDLLDGRIVNAFSSGFAALDAGAMQAFHQAQVEKSSAIMLGNLAELQKLAASLLTTRR